ncbi:hypothetical protein BBAL3_212 [Brevundimonas sp. BAL3]|nr:hypothetical protein BBAL3_212 [Brevundimonas sp. BAL3]
MTWGIGVSIGGCARRRGYRERAGTEKMVDATGIEPVTPSV